jgi:hypothetical protein
VKLEDFLSWNPSLAEIYDEEKPEACTLQVGLRYCASSKTATRSSSSTTRSTTTIRSSRSSTGITTPDTNPVADDTHEQQVLL